MMWLFPFAAAPARLAPADENGVQLHPRAAALPDLPQGPFVRLADNKLLTVDDTEAMISGDGGHAWSRHPLFDEAHPWLVRPERVLIRTRGNVIVLGLTDDNRKHWPWDDAISDAPGATAPTCALRSLDGGKTWTDHTTLHEDWTGAIRDVIQLRSGRVVMSTMKMLHHPGRHGVLTYASDDDGKTWRASNLIDLGGIGHHDGAMEATIIERRDGRLWMYIRTNWSQFFLAESTDSGMYWHLLGPTWIDASSAPAIVQQLASGRWIMVWNRLYPSGGSDGKRREGNRIWAAVPSGWYRSELSASLSDDDGETWSPPVVIARHGEGEISYPRVFEHTPGELWITVQRGPLRMSIHETDLLTS